MQKFTIPVALFIFKRYKTTLRIIDRLRAQNVSKVYLIGDGPRNDEEAERVRECREKIEKSLDWGCEVVFNYAEKNRGIYENIGKGAAWVFQREEKAIFLEDDNLPELSFFEYCDTLLSKYKDTENVLWVNGTNYLTEYYSSDSSSYMFTKHLLPCGWASWAEKYLRYYDGELATFNNKEAMKKFKSAYKTDRILYRQQLQSIGTTKRKLELGLPVSWDFQMCYSIRVNHMYGISPCRNQIKNIGVDDDSTHGGNSMVQTMVNRFCGMESMPLEFPLKHPTAIVPDSEYEKKTAKIIMWPLKTQILFRLSKLVKPFFGMNRYDSWSLRHKK